MKRKILKIAFVATVAMVSGINVFNAQKTETLSDIALANVEALANDEGTGWLDCANHGCFVDFSYDCLYPVNGYLIGYCPDMRGR